MEKENVFYSDFYIKELADVTLMGVFEEEGKYCATINKNIFYPHGGGQKGDKGKIIHNKEEYSVVNTVRDQYSDTGVLLLTDRLLPESLKNEKVTCQLDWAFRFKQMRLHSSLHLHHCMLEKVMNKKITPPKTSDIQEGFAFNRYSEMYDDDIVEKANQELRALIKEGAEIHTYPDPNKSGYRWWKCLSWLIPCGGTHVANVKEIGGLEIKHSKKKGKTTVNIKLVE